MTLLKTWLLAAVKLFHTVKDENLQWQSQNQDQIAALKHAQILAEQALSADLQKKTVQLEHEIDLLKTQNAAELAMFKTKCQQDIQDYQHYLNALDQLKRSIQTSYTHLPEAVAFTIHHHAKQLLNRMWETQDFAEKMQLEMQLITFMTAVHDDARLQLQGDATDNLPAKTLGLLKSP
ncbi:hypothetical protein JCM14076_03410 [Methylosoma difficile]